MRVNPSLLISFDLTILGEISQTEKLEFDVGVCIRFAMGHLLH